MADFLCESCRYGEVKIIELIKPLYAFSVDVHKIRRLTVFCNLDFCNKAKLVVKCENYKPKAGKIGKNIYQKTL